jgi:hypothetical protein
MIDISITFQEIAVNTKRTINRLQSDTERNKFSTRKHDTGLDKKTSVNLDVAPLFSLDNTQNNQNNTGDDKSVFEKFLGWFGH